MPILKTDIGNIAAHLQVMLVQFCYNRLYWNLPFLASLWANFKKSIVYQYLLNNQNIENPVLTILPLFTKWLYRNTYIENIKTLISKIVPLILSNSNIDIEAICHQNHIKPKSHIFHNKPALDVDVCAGTYTERHHQCWPCTSGPISGGPTDGKPFNHS